MRRHGIGNRPARRDVLFVLGLPIASLLSGCAMVDVQRSAPLDVTARWALLPILDYTETTMAGARVEDPLSTLLRTKFQIELIKYPIPAEAEALADLDERQRYQQALEWARKEKFNYGVTGSVNEWRYRNGADGEAAVGFSISVIEVASGRALWSATGSRSGWGRETASGVAQKLLRDMLGKLDVQREPAPARR